MIFGNRRNIKRNFHFFEHKFATSDFSLEVKAKAQLAVTKTDDGKTLTFAAGTQSSLVAAESGRVRSGVVPTGRSMRLNKPGLKCSAL